MGAGRGLGGWLGRNRLTEVRYDLVLFCPSCHQVYLLRLDYTGLLDQLPPSVVEDVDYNPDIARDELGHRKGWDKGSKAAEDNYKRVSHQFSHKKGGIDEVGLTDK